MKNKRYRLLSLGMAAVIASGAFNPGIVVQAAEKSGTQITEQQMQELLAESEDGGVTTRNRQSVHDPSIVKDTDGTYYVFGSHMGVAQTTDLKNWTYVTGEETDSTLFGTKDDEGNVAQASYEVAFTQNEFTGQIQSVINGETSDIDFGTFDAAAWIAENSVKGNMWAPDVIYNPTMGKWCMYLSLNGAKWDSCVILLTSDNITGSYVYQGPVVFTGFTKDDYKTTDIEYVLGEMDALPQKYQTITDESDGNWGTWWPHAIDPNVFYDQEGKLWLVYGSWSGGICMLELDESNGLRDYTVTYESNSETLGKNWTSDAYFGKRIAGGYYVSGEGPYIEYIDGYYFLFLSYGFYSPEGGYNMRIFRSESPDGEYVDAEGNSARYDRYVHNYSAADTRGERLMAGYKWDSMDKAETAQGHNSVLVDEDGKAYVIYHTKFTDGTADHELRVHQLFVNEDGWLAAAPYEYDGEELSVSGYQAAEVAGAYDVILHKYDQNFAKLAYETPSEVVLENDGSVSGALTGNWSVSGSNITITAGVDTYKGVLIEQKIDNKNYKKLCFTAVNQSGLCIWGTKGLDAAHAIEQTVANFAFGLPQAAFESFTLPDAGLFGTQIAWTSSKPEILAADGTLTGMVTEDTDVILTARISRDDCYYDLPFTVTVKPGSGAFAERTLIASYFTDDAQDLSTRLDGSLSVANPFYDGTTKGIDISGGVSVEFDVEKTGDMHMLAAILSFYGSGRLYFTPGSYLGYNALGGYYDGNMNGFQLVEDYIGDGAHVQIDLNPDGFAVFINGTLAYDQTIIGTDAGGGTLSNYGNVLTWLNESAKTLYFGSGSWWTTPGENEALCSIKNVACYVCESRSFQTVSYSKEEVRLETNSDITYETNPFYGYDVLGMDISYTVNFAQDAAKNGWDGIFSFFDSATGGRVSVQTNPYLCYNNGSGTHLDINNPNDGGTNWAAGAETGKDYRISISVQKDGVTMTVDGEKLSVSEKGPGTYAQILDFIGKTKTMTLGVGNAQTAYWGTELCTLKDISIEAKCYGKGTSPEIQKANVWYEKDEVVLAGNSALTVEENPFYGKTTDTLYLAYTINFAEDAAKNGWDGIFSFFNSNTTGRISVQTNPYICYNNQSGSWMDINHPDGTGATKWAPGAEKGKDYRVTILITETGVDMTVDGTAIAVSEASAGTDYRGLLDYLGVCDQLTFGVGLANSSFWNTEVCTLKDLVIASTTTKPEESNPGEGDIDDGNTPGDSGQGSGNTTGNGNTPNSGNTDTAEPEDGDTGSGTDGAVVIPPKGEQLTVEKKNETAVYTVTKKGKEVAFAGSSKSGSVIIPATVTIDGITYKVTSVAAKAFKGNKNMISVTIGNNIVTIGKEAFANCKNLKTIKIKSTKITKINKNAFQGIGKDAVIKAPKRKLAAYKKMLKNKGLSTKVKIKGY